MNLRYISEQDRHRDWKFPDARRAHFQWYSASKLLVTSRRPTCVSHQRDLLSAHRRGCAFLPESRTVTDLGLIGGTDQHHRATIQRGPSPSGPWENNPNNPILFNGADPSLPVQRTGHADIVEGVDGSWWGVALGGRPQGGNDSHIQLGMSPFDLAFVKH